MRKLDLRTVCLVCLFWVVCPIELPAATFSTLANFDGTDGAAPWSLVQGFNGDFYGTTSVGGTHGDGTVFEISAEGELTTLYSFCSQPGCSDGAVPAAGLAQATDGNFYGTTRGGGTGGGANSGCFDSCGTVFEITPAGKLTTLYSFCSRTNSEGHCLDGGIPNAGLMQATNGNFYGTTYAGGTSPCAPAPCYGYGTVFAITAGGKLTTLHSFDSIDGGLPRAGLVQASDGNFYGTTYAYGASSGSGTVFKITAGGKLTTLHQFHITDGRFPIGDLVQATNGNLYGTTTCGGLHAAGTVFEISPGGKFTTLYNFYGYGGGNCLEFGANGGLVQATNGNLYGTSFFSGANNFGTVFEITTNGKRTTLHSFDSNDGAYPQAGLMQATNGNLYGTTTARGTYGDGTVYTLGVGLGPFVQSLPTSGNVGAVVVILGNDLTDVSSVSFNGTPATFEVVSSTEIRTSVPSGATTGKVEVTTPSGTLTSNVDFRVS
jgi:uncharacterized repeat protein (TIGR03803 family)